MVDLYRIAIDEYRFEVRLNWDRMQYYAVVNSAVIAVGTSLIKDATTLSGLLLSGSMFAVGLVMAMIGVVAIHRGRDYYQETVLKKTVYEHLLGLNIPLAGFGNPKTTLAIGTTNGMTDAQAILRGRPPTTFWRRLTRNRIQSFFIWLLLLLGAIDLAALGYAGFRISEVARNTQAEVSEPVQGTPIIYDIHMH